MYYDSYYRGTYVTKADKLTLNFKQKVTNEITDEVTNKVRNETKTIKIESRQFAISKCGDKVRLRNLTILDLSNGSRYSSTNEKQQMDVLKKATAWRMISQ